MALGINFLLPLPHTTLARSFERSSGSTVKALRCKSHVRSSGKGREQYQTKTWANQSVAVILTVAMPSPTPTYHVTTPTLREMEGQTKKATRTTFEVHWISVGLASSMRHNTSPSALPKGGHEALIAKFAAAPDSRTQKDLPSHFSDNWRPVIAELPTPVAGI